MLRSRKIIRQEGGVAGRFRQPIAVTDGKPKGVFEATGGLLQEGPGAANHAPEALQPVSSEVLIGFQQELQKRRHNAHARDTLVRKPSPEAPSFEFSVQDRSAMKIKWGQDRDDRAIHMMDRQHAHQAVLCAEPMPRGDSIGVH